MAEAPDSLEDILSCQICLEDYEESGDHVPRILPWGNFVECPECRKKHRVVNNVRTFPQNKYILANVPRKEAAALKGEKSEEPKVDKCEEHGKELTLYCNQEGCGKARCKSCLTKYHRRHDVVEIEEGEKEVLAAKIRKTSENLQTAKNNLVIAAEEVERKSQACMENLRAKKEKCIRKITETYDTLIQNVNEQKNRNVAEITESLESIDEHLAIVNNINENMNTETVTHEELLAGIETITTITDSAALHLCGTRRYEFFGYRENQNTGDVIKSLCGHLEKRGRLVDLSESAVVLKEDKRVHPSEFTCKGKLEAKQIHDHCDTVPKINGLWARSRSL